LEKPVFPKMQGARALPSLMAATCGVGFPKFEEAAAESGVQKPPTVASAENFALPHFQSEICLV